MNTQPEIFHKTIIRDDPPVICDALSLLSGLSKSKIKRAMNKGAAWIQRPGGKKHRIRRATANVRTGDRVWLYYDHNILEQKPPPGRCLEDGNDYSIWHKPAGLVSQGTQFGDHTALTRQVEAFFHPKRPVYPVHRLDREVDGLILLAHHRKAASLLSALLRDNRIEKKYQACVKGNLRLQPVKGVIDQPLDGRRAVTEYEVLHYDQKHDVSLVRINIITGRLHQIRRHFDLIGYPVMGDPKYGRNNKSPNGLQLVAYAISFECPFGRGRISVEIDPVLSFKDQSPSRKAGPR